ncbi:hypothetical protein [Conchiformibius steedae]|uniref:Uncharacterized protein n=1 Tax=Conchiformibius steedae TaxID=153493 RepID=A0A3P2A5M4_9NEIS|nr:hypothetical protein [Conchiformibius steedae]RRD88943.1 hypothetical protein EII21_10430 [Conchiformibius steedae]
MIDINKFKKNGISDSEIQDVLSIKPEDFTIIKLISPCIIHDEIVIGYDCTYPIIVKLEGIFIHEEHNYRFVNSNTMSFLNCLAKYSEYCSNIVNYENNDELFILKIVKNYIEEMKNYDPKAFSNAQCYWAIIAQQMIDGNL